MSFGCTSQMIQTYSVSFHHNILRVCARPQRLLAARHDVTHFQIFKVLLRLRADLVRIRVSRWSQSKTGGMLLLQHGIALSNQHVLMLALPLTYSSLSASSASQSFRFSGPAFAVRGFCSAFGNYSAPVSLNEPLRSCSVNTEGHGHATDRFYSLCPFLLLLLFRFVEL